MPGPPDRHDTISAALCVFERSGHLLGIPVSAVREVLSGELPTPVPLAPAHLAGLVNVRGEPLPLVQIDGWIGAVPRRYRAGNQILVIESNGLRLGLVVDRVHDIRPGAESPAPASGGLDGRSPIGFRYQTSAAGPVAIIDPAELADTAVALARATFEHTRPVTPVA